MCAQGEGEAARKLGPILQGQRADCEATGDNVRNSILGTMCLLLTPGSVGSGDKHVRITEPAAVEEVFQGQFLLHEF